MAGLITLKPVFRRLRSLFIIDHCPVLPWWTTSGQDALGARARRISGRGLHYDRGPWRRHLGRWLLFFTWPLRSAIQILRLNAKHGAKVRDLSGKRRWRQLLDAVCLAACHFLPARHYYVYELFHSRSRQFGLRCLNETEMGNLFNWLNRGAASPAIVDKQHFGEWCREHRLPAPTSTAIIASGSSDTLPRCEPPAAWFVKPICGHKGKGMERWIAVGNGSYRDQEDGQQLSHEELTEHLAKKSRSRPLLVQPCLNNHSEIADLSPGSLAAIRLVTGRYPDGRIVVVAATFKMPKGRAITNNLGISSRVDLDSGRLGPAHAYSPFQAPFDRHPDTNSEIIGRRLPDWEQAESIALQAHGHLPEYVFLGWDIALTNAGPILLEGNANWDTLSIQKSHQTALTDLPFGAICAAWFGDNNLLG